MNNDLLQKETSRNYLLVEGSDDAHVFRSLLNHYQIIDRSSSDARRFKNTSTHFEIIPHEGIDNILRALRLEIIRGDVAYRRYGIVVDADEHLHITWQRFRSILDKSGYNEVPSVPRANGTTFRQAGLPTIGIWLMPDNTLPGMMEDFISFLRPPDDVFWPMAEDIVQRLSKKDATFAHHIKVKRVFILGLHGKRNQGSQWDWRLRKNMSTLTHLMLNNSSSGFASCLGLTQPSTLHPDSKQLTQHLRCKHQ